jgi:hypothetical protein
MLLKQALVRPYQQLAGLIPWFVQEIMWLGAAFHRTRLHAVGTVPDALTTDHLQHHLASLRS